MSGIADPVYLGAPSTANDPGGHGRINAKPAAMDEGEFFRIVRLLIDQARDYMQSEVLPQTQRIWQYYHGAVDQEPMGRIDLPGGEIVYEGSRVVETKVRDTVNATVPELYRVFAGTDEVVEFDPKQPEDEEGARQSTDYHTWLFWHNQGGRFLSDALLSWATKYLAVRVWWEESEREISEPFAGLPEIALRALQAEVESGKGDVIELEAEPEEDFVLAGQPTPDGGQLGMPQPIVTYKGTLTRRERKGAHRFALVPQEEILLDGEAQQLERSRIIGTDCFRTVSELVEMGLDYDAVVKHATSAQGRDDSNLRLAREHNGQLFGGVASDLDKSALFVRVVEAHVRVDRDRDGKAEVYRVVALGDNAEVVDWDEDEWPDYIVHSPFPIPHKVVGQGIAEVMIDRQDVFTALTRRILDNANKASSPRPMIDPEDEQAMLSLESWFGGPVLCDPGKIGWYATPFFANELLPIMQYFEQTNVTRSGISPAGMGLDPNALKGQTQETAAALVNAPASRIDYFARLFAENVMGPLFKALHKLSVRYQDQASTIRLRNKWVTMDPRSWNADMDVTVKVGLGTGTKGERIQALSLVIQKQEQMLATGSPLVNLETYHNALADLTNLIGQKNVARYFIEPTQEMQAQMAQAKQGQAQQMMATAQQQAQAQALIEKAKADVKAQAEAQLEQMRGQFQATQHAADLAHQKELEVLRHGNRMNEIQAQHNAKLGQQQVGTALKHFEPQRAAPMATPDGLAVPREHGR